MSQPALEAPQDPFADSEVVLEVEDLVKHFPVKEGIVFKRQTGAVQAVDGVSFKLRRGETLGIIGRNGAGKSTVLQLLAETLLPTTGELTIKGRIAALLELGSGFNPEFTGRENIYMYGAILGMSPEKLNERCQAIIDFADIGPAIEQPVKTYQ